MKSLTHHGVLFPPEYEFQNFQPDLKLSPLAEEMLYCYASKIETEYVKKPEFNINFYSCLKHELNSSQLKLKFPDDFKKLFNVMNKYREKHSVKNMSIAQKEERKKKSELIKKKYGFAIVNGIKEPLGNFNVEPPSIFIGRGDSPYIGLWKYRVQPEDVIINYIPEKENNKVGNSSACSKPPEPPKGHKWKEVISNPNITYIARYIETIGKDENSQPILKNPKEVRFAAASSITSAADLKKYEKADLLLDNWDKVQKYIREGIESDDENIRECALIAWLIQYTSIRIGSEETENGVVGASTLKVKNVKIEETYSKEDKETVKRLFGGGKSYILHLNFLGKDSIEYNNSFVIPSYIALGLKKSMKNKKEDEMLFSVNANQVNQFLGECLSGLTAKVFRTAWAKKVLLEIYKPNDFVKSWPDEYKVLKLKILILDVSLRLNHKKTTKTVLNNVLDKLNTQLMKEVEKLEELKKILKDVKNDKTKKNMKERIKKLDWKIKTLQLKIEFAEKSYGINLSTALTNYINPKVIYEICKSKNIKLDKIYNKGLMERFKNIFK